MTQRISLILGPAQASTDGGGAPPTVKCTTPSARQTASLPRLSLRAHRGRSPRLRPLRAVHVSGSGPSPDIPGQLTLSRPIFRHWRPRTGAAPTAAYSL